MRIFARRRRPASRVHVANALQELEKDVSLADVARKRQKKETEIQTESLHELGFGKPASWPILARPARASDSAALELASSSLSDLLRTMRSKSSPARRRRVRNASDPPNGSRKADGECAQRGCKHLKLTFVTAVCTAEDGPPPPTNSITRKYQLSVLGMVSQTGPQEQHSMNLQVCASLRCT